MGKSVNLFDKVNKKDSSKVTKKKYNLTKVSAVEVEANRSSAYTYLFS